MASSEASSGAAKPKPKWRSAVDKRTGRTYYYHSVTRETTWTKPMELSTPEEIRQRREAEQRKRDFFQDMEANMRRNVARGLLAPDIEPSGAGSSDPLPLDTEGLVDHHLGESQDLEDSPLPHTHKSPRQPHEAGAASDAAAERRSWKAGRPAPVKYERMVRTISTIDDLVLEEAKRSEPYSPGTRESPLEGLFTSTRTRETSITDMVPMLARRNSTSTIFVDSTMSKPDKDATIHCVCAVIRVHMLESLKSAGTEEHPRGSAFHDFEDEKAAEGAEIPSLQTLIAFFRDVYTKSQMEIECIIMSLIYVERLIKVTKGAIQVRPHNWKSLLLSAMIMSSKVWDDLSMWNADFSQVCPSFTLQRINELELALLDVLGYSVKVSASDYAKYYFLLRSHCVRLGLTPDLDSLGPLDLQHAKKLQALSEEYEAAAQVSAASTLKSRSASMPDVLPSDGMDPRRHTLAGHAAAPLATEKASIEQLVSMRVVPAGQQPSPAS